MTIKPGHSGKVHCPFTILDKAIAAISQLLSVNVALIAACSYKLLNIRLLIGSGVTMIAG